MMLIRSFLHRPKLSSSARVLLPLLTPISYYYHSLAATGGSEPDKDEDDEQRNQTVLVCSIGGTLVDTWPTKQQALEELSRKFTQDTVGAEFTH